MRVALLACVLAGCIPLYAFVNVGADGTIVDAMSGKPVAGAEVTVGQEHPLTARTDANGRFGIPAQREWILFFLLPFPQHPSYDMIAPRLLVQHPHYVERDVRLHDMPRTEGVVDVGPILIERADG